MRIAASLLVVSLFLPATVAAQSTPTTRWSTSARAEVSKPVKPLPSVNVSDDEDAYVLEYPNGQTEVEVGLNRMLRWDGEFRRWDELGNLSVRGQYRNGFRVGYWETFWQNAT